MKAIVLKEFGAPENLSLDDFPIPRVIHGSVLLRAAASANPVDVSVRKGSHSAHRSLRRSDATSLASWRRGLNEIIAGAADRDV